VFDAFVSNFFGSFVRAVEVWAEVSVPVDAVLMELALAVEL
jgi:hypothetical protein